MSKNVSANDFKVTGNQTWVNAQTGETREVLEAEVDTSKTKTTRPNFAIAVLTKIIRLTDLVGNKKMQVVNYILDHMAKHGELANTLVITQKELAEKADVSIKTVSITLNLLDDANIIKKKTGVIKLHPDVLMVGDGDKRKSLLIDFKNFDSKQK